MTALVVLNTRFGLIRHAQTEWNRDKKIQGSLDSPLTEQGFRQAQKWGKELQLFFWDYILASDMPRVKATVEQINRGIQLPVRYDPLLREQNWGEWEGKNLKELQQRQGLILKQQVALGWDFCPPGGESRRQVLKRSQQALLNAAQRWPQKNILLVSHQGVMKSLLYHLSNRLFLPNEKPLFKKGYYLHTLNYIGQKLEIDEIDALRLSR